MPTSGCGTAAVVPPAAHTYAQSVAYDGDYRGPSNEIGACPFAQHRAFTHTGRCPGGCHEVQRYSVLCGTDPPKVPVSGYTQQQSEQMALRMHTAERELEAARKEMHASKQSVSALLDAIEAVVGPVGDAASAASALAAYAAKRRKRPRPPSPSPASPSLGSSATDGPQSASGSDASGERA